MAVLISILPIAGLILDLIGVTLLFCFSPEQFPDPQWNTSFAVEGESAIQRERWKRLQPIRRRLARCGFFSLALGFLLQLTAEVLMWYSL